MEPRKPTEAEKEELIAYNTKRFYRTSTQADQEEQSSLVDGASIAVFDNYVTDGPGYAGKVMVVVWGGSPTFTETYTWQRPFLKGEGNIPVGQINWHDGKHEPKLHREYIEQGEPEE